MVIYTEQDRGAWIENEVNCSLEEFSATSDLRIHLFAVLGNDWK